MSVFDNGHSGLILGSLAVVGKLLVFDLGGDRLGIVEYACSTLAEVLPDDIAAPNGAGSNRTGSNNTGLAGVLGTRLDWCYDHVAVLAAISGAVVLVVVLGTALVRRRRNDAPYALVTELDQKLEDSDAEAGHNAAHDAVAAEAQLGAAIASQDTVPSGEQAVVDLPASMEQ